MATLITKTDVESAIATILATQQLQPVGMTHFEANALWLEFGLSEILLLLGWQGGTHTQAVAALVSSGITYDQAIEKIESNVRLDVVRN